MNIKKISLFLCMAFLFQNNLIDAAEEKNSDRSGDNRKRKADDNDDSSQKKGKSFRMPCPDHWYIFEGEGHYQYFAGNVRLL